MKRYFNSLSKSVWVVLTVLTLGSCSDWMDHYKNDSSYNGSNLVTLAEAIQNIPGAENFIEALQNTYMFNGDKLTSDTYWDLLGDDQFITVWLPLDSSVDDEDWTKYKKEEKSYTENKRAGQEFIQNHIARFRYTVSSKTDEKVVMMSNKTYPNTSAGIGGVPYKTEPNSINILCKNGILHLLGGQLKYRPTIYEYLTRNSHDIKSDGKKVAYDYRTILGDFYDKYTEEKIDELKSVSSGINPVTGVMEYVDSVIIRKSILLDKFGDISEEDSTYYMVLPTPALWTLEYDSISKFFTYGKKETDPDSLQVFYTKYSMMTDMLFNMNSKIQLSKKDSVISTTYSRNYNLKNRVRFNVYDKPFAANGLFKSYDSVKCSNGMIYIVDKWPFDDAKTFNRVIKLEAEEYDDYDNTVILHNRAYISSVKGQKLTNVFAARISSKDSKPDWETEFKIRNTLKGKYKVKLVVFPDTSSVKNVKSNQIAVDILYSGDNPMPDTLHASMKDIDEPPFYEQEEFYNNISKIDTIQICEIDVPACNYDKDSKNEAKLRIKVQSLVQDATKYSGQLWLDCIILEPVIE